MKHTLLKFLADTMDYEEVIHGVEELNNDQLVVIFEKLKAQLAEKQHKNAHFIVCDSYGLQTGRESLCGKRWAF